MSGKQQTALERYKARRSGDTSAGVPLHPDRQNDRARRQWKNARMLVLLLLLLGVAWPFLPRTAHPVRLTYEVDLEEAPRGTLTITMIAEGKLPPAMDLEFPPGIFGDGTNGVTVSAPSAHAITPAGEQGQHLIIDQIPGGWRLQTGGVGRAGFIYRVDLARSGSLETDIRRHISTPVNGGVRAAGFEVFLEPVGVPVSELTVTVHNPGRLPVLVPWPALVRGDQVRDTGPQPDLPPAQEAHLGFGEGYLPALEAPGGGGAGQQPRDRAPAAATVPTNLFYHPRDLADLNNSLLICGDIRTLTDQARDCVIQYATDRSWYFDDRRVLDLVRKIARTEIGFFGSAPTDQITVLLAANEVNSPEGFDVYGVHTGSSVLVMVDPETTWGMLVDEAASVIAHEMFHGWLGEAIAQKDPATLWFTEGATSWYAARMLTAAGVWEPAHSRSVLAARLERDYARNALLGKIPVAEAAAQVMGSREVVRFAYAGGTAACMSLDEYLAARSGQRAPLDLVLRHLFDTRDGRGLTRAKLEEACLAVTGVDIGVWLDTYVYGLEPVPPVKTHLAAHPAGAGGLASR